MIDLPLFRDVLASEWTKLRTVRSTYWTILVAIILGIGLGCAISAGNAHAYHSMSFRDRLEFDPTAFSTAGLFFAQLALGVFAILTMTSEYSTGTIRTTMAAVPQRGYTLVAKALLICVISLVVATGIAFAAFFICQQIFAHYHLAVSIHAPGVLRAVIGGGLYVGVLTLFAIGLATIIRHTAGAITTLVAVVFIVPSVSQLLPHAWKVDFSRYLPANAGSAIIQVVHIDNDTLRPWPGFIVFVIWAAVILAIGWSLLRARDV
jgi:hypothetical protein